MDVVLAGLCGGIAGYILKSLCTRQSSMLVQAYMMKAAQLVAVRMENQSLRKRGKRPSMPAYRKWLFGMAYRFLPTALATIGFSPETLVNWHRRFCKSYRWLISSKAKQSSAGRPRIDADLEALILDVKADHPHYGYRRIAETLHWQTDLSGSVSTVRNVLLRNWWRPRDNGLLERWRRFLANHAHVNWSNRNGHFN